MESYFNQEGKLMLIDINFVPAMAWTQGRNSFGQLEDSKPYQGQGRREKVWKWESSDKKEERTIQTLYVYGMTSANWSRKENKKKNRCGVLNTRSNSYIYGISNTLNKKKSVNINSNWDIFLFSLIQCLPKKKKKKNAFVLPKLRKNLIDKQPLVSIETAHDNNER